MKPYIYLLIFLPILIGCNSNREVESLLDHIDSFMETSPDSAFSLLKKIESNTLPSGSELQARYAFMYSKAEYKCYIDAPDDSLITIAVDYYDKYGTDEQKFSSHLYHGCILSALTDYDSSSEAFLKRSLIQME